jgi:hypothetical protein
LADESSARDRARGRGARRHRRAPMARDAPLRPQHVLAQQDASPRRGIVARPRPNALAWFPAGFAADGFEGERPRRHRADAVALEPDRGESGAVLDRPASGHAGARVTAAAGGSAARRMGRSGGIGPDDRSLAADGQHDRDEPDSKSLEHRGSVGLGGDGRASACASPAWIKGRGWNGGTGVVIERGTAGTVTAVGKGHSARRGMGCRGQRRHDSRREMPPGEDWAFRGIPGRRAGEGRKRD